MKKQIENKIIKKLSNVAIKNSMESINTCCYFLCYQPKIPKSVMKLKSKNVK